MPLGEVGAMGGGGATRGGGISFLNNYGIVLSFCYILLPWWHVIFFRLIYCLIFDLFAGVIQSSSATVSTKTAPKFRYSVPSTTSQQTSGNLTHAIAIIV